MGTEVRPIGQEKIELPRTDPSGRFVSMNTSSVDGPGNFNKLGLLRDLIEIPTHTPAGTLLDGVLSHSLKEKTTSLSRATFFGVSINRTKKNSIDPNKNGLGEFISILTSKSLW